tara:strand:- start:2490 stop:2759 length:270 start_codon:yes stop_codon:yes gene_type:complete
MKELKFERKIDSAMVRVDELGVWIACGWTQGVPKSKAVEYIQKYNTAPNAGFFEHKGSVIFSHADGKITFTQRESDAIVALIKTAYLGG